MLVAVVGDWAEAGHTTVLTVLLLAYLAGPVNDALRVGDGPLAVVRLFGEQRLLPEQPVFILSGIFRIDVWRQAEGEFTHFGINLPDASQQVPDIVGALVCCTVSFQKGLSSRALMRPGRAVL